jgi:hypothetical protein
VLSALERGALADDPLPGALQHVVEEVAEVVGGRATVTHPCARQESSCLVAVRAARFPVGLQSAVDVVEHAHGIGCRSPVLNPCVSAMARRRTTR